MPLRTLREPRNIELWYINQMRLVWTTIANVYEKGLSELYNVWPEPRLDAQKTPREMLEEMQRLAASTEDPFRISRPGKPPPWRIGSSHAPRIRPVGPTATRVLDPIPDIIDASPASVDRVLAWIESSTNTIADPALLNAYADWVAKVTADRNAEDLGSILRIDLRETIPQFLVDEFRDAQVELITGALRDQLGDISNVIENAHSSGLRVEELRKQLIERYDVSKRRGSLIARDQVLSLNSKINRYRQQELGIEEYKWITARDSRVRDRHRKLHGRIFKWGVPVGKAGYPGFEIQCRCIAQPVPPDWLDA